MSLTYASKIKKEGKVSDLETKVAQALYDLQVSPSSKDLGDALRALHFTSARSVGIQGGRQAIVVFVPYRLHRSFKLIQLRLIRELEKKFGGVVTLVAQRRVLKKPGRNNQRKQQKRPRSRTVAAVHEAVLEDLVFPTNIVGKRTRYHLDGTRTLKVYLDPEDEQVLSGKVHAFSTVYKKLTGKRAAFLFPTARA